MRVRLCKTNLQRFASFEKFAVRLYIWWTYSNENLKRNFSVQTMLFVWLLAARRFACRVSLAANSYYQI